MSTDLYGVRIMKTIPQENKVVMKVFVVYYDVEYKRHQVLPEDPSFFFRILSEREGALGQEVADDHLFSEEWVDLNTYKFISRVDMISTSNFPLLDYSNIYDFYYERYGTWEDEEKLVQAVFEVTVTDWKYAKHLEIGKSWGTTSYPTKSMKVSAKQGHPIPDLSKLVIRIKPFEGKEGEEGNIRTALFSKDSTKLFLVSDVGEVVAYDTHDWREKWRTDTGEWFGSIECNDSKGLLWLGKKAVLNFEGEKVEQTILPDFETGFRNPRILTSPKGDYFLFSNHDDHLIMFDSTGKKLFDHKSPDRDSLYAIFFADNMHIMVRGEASGTFTIMEIETGKEVKVFNLEGAITAMTVNASGSLLSVNDLTSNSTKIIELNNLETIFDYSTKHLNDDFISPCIWAPNNKWVVIITTGMGQRHNLGYGGYLSVYPISDRS
jgi:hypothetical protein